MLQSIKSYLSRIDIFVWCESH